MAKKPRQRRGQSSYTKPVAAQSPPKRPTDKFPRVVDGEYQDPNGALITMGVLAGVIIFWQLGENSSHATRTLYYMIMSLFFAVAGAVFWLRYSGSIKAGAPRLRLKYQAVLCVFLGVSGTLGLLLRLLFVE